MFRFLLLCVALLLAVPCFAQQTPTTTEMAFIYELNRARSDPQRYDTENNMGGILSGVQARPPLALNLYLVQSARFHATEMANNGYFAHQSTVTGDWPNKMARDAGYVIPASWPDDNNYLESIAGIFSSGAFITYAPNDALKDLLVDTGHNPPGHRIHLLAMDSFNAAFREVGTGYAEGDGVSGYQSGAYWAIHTGRHDTQQLWLTGVVYNDTNSNGRYDEFEGIQGATISATGPASPSTTSTVGGGWSLPVTAGDWDLTCSGGSFNGTATASVTVSTANKEVDFASGVTTGEVDFGNQITAPPAGTGGTGDSNGGGCVAHRTTTPALWLLLLCGCGLVAFGWSRRPADARSTRR